MSLHSRTARVVWLARIPQRIGYTSPSRKWCLTHPIARRTEARRMRKRTFAEIRTLIDDPNEKSAESFPRAAHHTYDYLNLAAVLGGKNEPLAHRHDVQGRRHRIGPPHQRAVLRIQAPDEPVVRALDGSVIAAEV